MQLELAFVYLAIWLLMLILIIISFRAIHCSVMAG